MRRCEGSIEMYLKNCFNDFEHTVMRILDKYLGHKFVISFNNSIAFTNSIN